MDKFNLVRLHVYRGKSVNYDENGNVVNENHPVDLRYPDEYSRYVSYLKNMGFCKVSVDKIYFNETEVTDKRVYAKISEEIAKATKDIEPVDLKKENEDLKKRLDALEKAIAGEGKQNKAPAKAKESKHAEKENK